MKRIFGIFQIRKEERLPTLLACIVFTLLNAMQAAVYFNDMTNTADGNLRRFIKAFHLSGFDPITYSVITDWGCRYNVFRHPLLAYFVWPFAKLNSLLISLTGMNWALVITCLILIVFATYGFVFLSRIFNEIIGLRRKEAYVMTMMTYSFGYIMLATIAPDHFGPSMTVIVMTLYLCGLKLQRGRALNWWQTVVMFFFTAGISLNNGLKTFLMALMTRRRRFFKPGYLVVAVMLPSVLMWGAARFTYTTFVWPKEVAAKEKKKMAEQRKVEKIRKSIADTIAFKDSARIEELTQKEVKRLEEKKEKRRKMSAYYKHTGKPIANGEFSRWTDISTSRLDIAIESLFGEAIMIHEDYLLGDVLVNRPVIVHYKNWFNYIIEALLLIMATWGAWMGRRSRFMWTALSCFFLDMALHMGLGFGINEIFIMSAHYLFVIPIAMAFILPALPQQRRNIMLGIFTGITLYLWIWNVTMLAEYLY